ncbi:hypothetical protein Ga0451573_001583 [Peptococcaceae bacterium DYL19]|nr:hypothetical protein [Phosphitispora fastidiosa]
MMSKTVDRDLNEKEDSASGLKLFLLILLMKMITR